MNWPNGGKHTILLPSFNQLNPFDTWSNTNQSIWPHWRSFNGTRVNTNKLDQYSWSWSCSLLPRHYCCIATSQQVIFRGKNNNKVIVLLARGSCMQSLAHRVATATAASTTIQTKNENYFNLLRVPFAYFQVVLAWMKYAIVKWRKKNYLHRSGTTLTTGWYTACHRDHSQESKQTNKQTQK